MRVYFADPPIEWAVAIFTGYKGQQNEIHRGHGTLQFNLLWSFNEIIASSIA